MSEEILRALMQLFAIISKQDDGLTDAKMKYVELFLKQQIKDEQVAEYLNLFEEHAKEKKKRSRDKDKGTEDSSEEKSVTLTSMTDSVRTLGICKKINKTLTQKQKIVVVVRLLELVNSDRIFSEQRMAIIDTVSQVFKIEHDEYKSIEEFVKGTEKAEFNDENVLIIADNSDDLGNKTKFIKSEQLNGLLILLQVSSVGLYFLRYDGSNQIVLNGLTMLSRKIYLFASGSTIKPPFGKTIYYSDISAVYLSASTDSKLSFNANNVVYKFKNGNLGLRNVSISEGPGKLIGIMGASGAGKTTLLNVLAGLEAPTEGEVLINGYNLHEDSEKLEGVIGYVPQDDLLIEELTVFENLFYNAKLCFKNLSEDEIVKLVITTLSNLGLLKTKGLKVGSPLEKTISGGQRKRLNIALELIREPSVLFLDEPTSGLSSKDSENILDLLRQLALKGKLIFVVIHQPSSDIYKAFDKIIFLDTGGYLIFNGNPVEAVTYFKTLDLQVNSDQGECVTCGNVNSEIIFNIVEAKIVDEYGNLTANRKVSPEKWLEHYEKRASQNKIKDESEPPSKSLHIPNKIKQFLVFLTRDFKSKISNKQYILINLLETPVLALFLSFLIRYIADPESDIYVFRENENIPAYILMCIVVSLFVGLTVSAEEIFKDRKILKRERFLNLSKSSYLLSKVTILFALSAIQTLFLVLIGNTIIGLHGMHLEYWFMLFSISCFANVLGLNISNSFNSAVTIYIIIPLLIIPQMVLAGAMFSFDKLNRNIGGGYHVPAIAQVMPSRWAYEGLVVNQYVHNNYKEIWYNFEKLESGFDYKVAYYLPELKKILDETLELQESTEKEAKSKKANNLILLQNELKQEMLANKSIVFTQFKELIPDKFNAEIAEETSKYLDALNEDYNKKYNLIITQKEIKFEHLKGMDEAAALRLKNEFDNEYLDDLVKNAFIKKKIFREGNKLFQVMDPIYREPKETTFFSLDAPFYSPFKNMFGLKLSTFTFNIIILWAMTLFTFLTLYFNILSKILNVFSLIRVKKTLKPLQQEKIEQAADVDINEEEEEI